MTQEGSVYCAVCWGWFRTTIVAQLGQLPDELLLHAIHTRNSGDQCLYTTQQRRLAQQSGSPFCSHCFSTAVVVVTAENKLEIESGLPLPDSCFS